MSMDLNFWKYKEDTAHDHSTVYQAACCDGEVMEVLEVLPIDEILKKLSEEEKKWLKKIAQKSDLLKNPNPQRGRK